MIVTVNTLDNPMVASSGVIQHKGDPFTRDVIHQVGGLVPFTLCEASECREWDECCFTLKVFGDLSDIDPFKNDRNSFLFDFPLQNSVFFHLDKWNGSTWISTASLSNNTYGTYFNYNSIVDHLNYKGFRINWRAVLNVFGSGIYTIRVAANTYGKELCYRSEPFCLQEFSCDRAHSTVRFDTLSSGVITKHRVQHDFCGMSWADSIRFGGMFGFDNSGYEENFLKLQTGLVKQGRTEQGIKYELRTRYLPYWLHDRFSTFGLMATKIFVNDYNKNSPSYDIKELAVKFEGDYKPDWNTHTRRAPVKVKFADRYQDVVKSFCCDSDDKG